MASDTHRYVGGHAQEINGVMRAPGDFLKLGKEDLEDPYMKDLLAAGTVVDLKIFSSTSDKGGDK